MMPIRFAAGQLRRRRARLISIRYKNGTFYDQISGRNTKAAMAFIVWSLVISKKTHFPVIFLYSQTGPETGSKPSIGTAVGYGFAASGWKKAASVGPKNRIPMAR